MNISAQSFARDLKQEPQPDPKANQVHRTIKLWGSISADVETLVSNSGMSRNEVMNRLMEIGIEELRKALGSDEFQFFGCDDEEHARYVCHRASLDEANQ